MAREFTPHGGLWQRFAPAPVQAALSLPTPIARATMNEDGSVEPFVGRIELVMGRLGAGKTTWSALRATRLARATDRELVTNGVGWPAPWRCITSFEEMNELRNVVFAWDELHLMLPSSKGLLGADVERFLIRWLSLCRKRGICVVGTTQAWTRCATHYRQLVTTVWLADFVQRGKLHMATPFDHPEDGGHQVFARQWFGPAAANIPTKAIVWRGFDLDDDGDEDDPLLSARANRAQLAAPGARLLAPPSTASLTLARNVREVAAVQAATSQSIGDTTSHAEHSTE